MAETLRPDPRWLFAVVQDGLVVAGRDRELELELEAPYERRARLLELLIDGADPAAIADVVEADETEARELIERLGEIGALVESPDPDASPPGVMLADAVLAAARGEAVSGQVWTGTELLVLPEDCEPGVGRRALKSFIGGITSDARLFAYSYVATWHAPTVWGDHPDAKGMETATAALHGLDPGAVHVVDLLTGGVETAAGGAIGSLGAERTHRLGVVLSEGHVDVPGGLQHRLAVYAIANLRQPSKAEGRLGRGTAESAELAGVIARAEAAERYATADVGRHELVRAAAAELDRPVTMSELFPFNERQRRTIPGLDPDDAGEQHLWVAARGPGGSQRMVAAECVFMRVQDPERRIPPSTRASSSGVAAHTDPEEARLRAFCELVERDAFMWHWVQRVSRERLDRASLPPVVREQLDAADAGGFEAHLVNLTLDAYPVVLAVLIGRGWICPGIASHPDPARAAAKALGEAISIAWSAAVPDRELEPLAMEDVDTPEEHLRFHHMAGLVEEDRFLAGTPDAIGIGEIATPEGSVEEVAAGVGELLTFDLGSPATAPFAVVRAIVPGMIPISFGYDREPLGVPRLTEPKTPLDGRVIGERLDTRELGPLTPHPFP